MPIGGIKKKYGYFESIENTKKQDYIKKYYKNIKDELIITPVGKLVINFIGILFIESAKNYLKYTVVSLEHFI